MASDSPTIQAYRGHRVLFWIGGVIALLIIALFVASFFLDDIVRARTQIAMNKKLTGYHVSLEHAHLQLLGGALTLNGLRIVQEAHPSPTVAVFPMMRFSVQVEELFSRHIVADVLLHRPKIHIDETQFVAEKNSKTPMRQEGWQDALEAAYPFKINRFTIDHGDVVYIQDASTKPLHLADVDFVADNIRNIHEPENDYPSRFHARLVIFDQGRAIVDGHANFLEEPFPGARAKYTISNVPLNAFDPEIRQLNISVTGGHLSSDGLLEYSPKITRVDVNDASVQDIGVDYVHLRQTQKQEAQRVKEAGKAVEAQNNRPAVVLTVREFDIGHSNFAYEDKTANPNYKLFFNDADMTIKNLANHQRQGPANLSLHGKFMGTGDSSVAGDFLASNAGPAFNLKVAIQNTDLPSLNDLMRSYGRFDVAAGKLSVYSQVAIKDGNIDGYVKPMFSDLQVYSLQKDKNTSIMHQAKELAIGGASHLFKNHRTEQVATDVDLKGKLSSPDINTWQALGQVLRNAFIQAIIPGFDRAVASDNAPNATKQANAH
jgi:hypothetical protein